MTQKPIGSEHRLHDPDTGIVVELIDFGATVTRILVPDHDGRPGDVLLGCPTPEDHAGDHPHFNCLVGRYSNRITNAAFELDGQHYALDANIPPHQLHGGSPGFSRRLWTSRAVDRGVAFAMTSPDGDAGFPGELDVEAVYRLVGNVLRLELTATTTKPTPVSLTSHHYYNLSGVHGTRIDDHLIRLNASAYLPVSADLTQLGEIASVAGTPFDLRNRARIGDRLDSSNEQIELAGGFDHTFVIDGEGMREAAQVIEPVSGRRLTVNTDQPGVQLYTCNTLSARGKDGVRYRAHQGFCLETQQFPDAPNHSNYPDPTLRPGATYRAVTEFVFDKV